MEDPWSSPIFTFVSPPCRYNAQGCAWNAMFYDPDEFAHCPILPRRGGRAPSAFPTVNRFFDGPFEWGRGALNSQQRRFPARADEDMTEEKLRVLEPPNARCGGQPWASNSFFLHAALFIA